MSLAAAEIGNVADSSPGKRSNAASSKVKKAKEVAGPLHKNPVIQVA